jgi:hypothetical protein
VEAVHLSTGVQPAELPEARNASLEGRLINFGASWPDFCARRDDTLFTSDNVTSFGSGFGLAA